MIKMDDIRESFPILKEITYLDSASTSLTPNEVIESIEDYYKNYNANSGRGIYKTSIKTSQKIEETRNKISDLIHGKPNEIIFTKNTTEAINLVANGLEFEKGNNVIVSNMEHHSNFLPWLNLKLKGVEIKVVNGDEKGIVRSDEIDELIDSNTKLVSISHITNSIGSKQDLKRIEKTVHNHTTDNVNNDNKPYFFVDGAQSLGHVPIDMSKLKADFMAFPGHKGLLGPTGTGFLYMKEDLHDFVKVQNLGGGTVTDVSTLEYKLEKSPQRFEGGTLNISGIIGLSSAIDYINRIKIENIEKHTSKLTKELYKGIETVDNSILYGDLNNIHSIVSFNLENFNPHDIGKILDETGNICVRTGHHCAIPAIKHLKSKEGMVRASLHCYNNKEDIERLIETVHEISQLSL